MLHTFLLAARAVGPSLVRNAARNPARTFVSGAGFGHLEFGRVAKSNFQALHGGEAVVGDPGKVIRCIREGVDGVVFRETLKQFWIMYWRKK